MVGSLQKPVWLMVACAALVAQVAPQAWGGDCDRGARADPLWRLAELNRPPSRVFPSVGVMPGGTGGRRRWLSHVHTS
jgi:hypothetical protein